MSTIKVLSPVAKGVMREKELAPRPTDLNGKKVGLLFNTKANADIFLNGVGEILAARFSPAEITFMNPRMMIHPLLPEFTPEFEKPRDCVVSAWGD